MNSVIRRPKTIKDKAIDRKLNDYLTLAEKEDYSFEAIALKHNTLPKIHRSANPEYLKIFEDYCTLYEQYQALGQYDGTIFNYYNTLYEFLSASDSNCLIGALSALPGYIRYVYDYRTDIIEFEFDPDATPYPLKFSEQDEVAIRNACIAFGYCEQLERYIDKNLLVLTFSPNYTTEVTDQIYDEAGNPTRYLWHICRKDVYDNKISKTGIIPKAKRKYSRNYAPRVYVFLNPISEPQLLHAAKQFVKSSTDITEKTKHLYTDWCLIKIDLTKGNIRNNYRFFEDTEYPIKYTAAFTYETINPRCLSLERTVHISLDEVNRLMKK